MNRLAHETSPYLLQHADNPVEWFPWGPEALEKARAEDKPILLSVGYAACHWCHVMEHESFEDADVAALMNARFVNVKVDREERPDLDHVYQLAVQLLGRSGGWPLTAFLTPDQKPFFAGTYFPTEPRYGMPSFRMLLDAIDDAWRTKRREVHAQADEMAEAIRHASEEAPRARPKAPGVTGLGLAAALGDQADDVVRQASVLLLARLDATNGGFGARPKFPNTMGLDVLVRRALLGDDEPEAERARQGVELALDRMRAGGVFDQLRGGFHRYSTDATWLVPHFEKMLYDNALLLRAYVDGFRVFGDDAHAETALDVVGWLFAEMLSETGGFFASQDADSEGEEGTFFVFRPADVAAALGHDALAQRAALAFFGITDDGNFEATGASVLSAARALGDVARELGVPEPEARAAVERARAGLLAHREKRARPLRDDKVLTSWNGLVIGALAEASRVLGEPAWRDAAARAFDDVSARRPEGALVGRYHLGGQLAKAPAFLDDYAYLGNAALDLYEATGEPRFALAARDLATEMRERFWHAESSSFCLAPASGEKLLARTRDVFDQAVPAPAASAALLCARLATLVDAAWEQPARAQLDALEDVAKSQPLGLGATVCALDRLRRGAVEIVITGPEGPERDALVDAAFARFVPNRAIVHVPADGRASELAGVRERAIGKDPTRVAAYVCRGSTCSAPAHDASSLHALL